MPSGPLVSVIIPVYNAGSFLRPALESILEQTYRDLEILIVDDGSTDDCLETIRDIHDNRITIFRQQNAGKSVALNFALERLKGDYYLIQDADDLSYPTRVEKLVEVMESQTDLAAVFSGYDLIIGNRRVAPRFFFKDRQTCKQDILAFRMPSHDPTGMYRMALVKQMRYDPELRIGQGYDYILRVGEKFPMCVIAECLYSYRINFSSNTRLNKAKIRDLQVRQVILKAAARRGGAIFLSSKKSGKFIEESDYGISSHFMESVLDLRKAKNWRVSFRTALTSILFKPYDLRYYKPLLYSLLPITTIRIYRRLKYRV